MTSSRRGSGVHQIPAEPPRSWPEARLLGPVRAWARGETEGLDWVVPGYSEEADRHQLQRVLPRSPREKRERFIGRRMAEATAPGMARAARDAERAGQPGAMLGLELLFAQAEWSTEARAAWWRVARVRPRLVRGLLTRFGLGEVARNADAALMERLLSWLPRFVADRGNGEVARELFELVERRASYFWMRLPGERGGYAAGAQRVLATEAMAVRPLQWFVRRPLPKPRGATTPAPQPLLHISGGLLCSQGGPYPLMPEDAVIRLEPDTSGAARREALLRALPPWSELRYLPPRGSAEGNTAR